MDNLTCWRDLTIFYEIKWEKERSNNFLSKGNDLERTYATRILYFLERRNVNKG